jgi:hypothetical protein
MYYEVIIPYMYKRWTLINFAEHIDSPIQRCKEIRFIFTMQLY